MFCVTMLDSSSQVSSRAQSSTSQLATVCAGKLGSCPQVWQQRKTYFRDFRTKRGNNQSMKSIIQDAKMNLNIQNYVLSLYGISRVLFQFEQKPNNFRKLYSVIACECCFDFHSAIQDEQTILQKPQEHVHFLQHPFSYFLRFKVVYNPFAFQRGMQFEAMN